MLLSYGADPNIRVIGDIATNAVLRPPLAELIASNEDVKPEELRLLMKYGARVSSTIHFVKPHDEPPSYPSTGHPEDPIPRSRGHP